MEYVTPPALISTIAMLGETAYVAAVLAQLANPLLLVFLA